MFSIFHISLILHNLSHIIYLDSFMDLNSRANYIKEDRGPPKIIRSRFILQIDTAASVYGNENKATATDIYRSQQTAVETRVAKFKYLPGIWKMVTFYFIRSKKYVALFNVYRVEKFVMLAF